MRVVFIFIPKVVYTVCANKVSEACCNGVLKKGGESKKDFLYGFQDFSFVIFSGNYI